MTAAVQPLELAAHNDTLDILMMPESTTDAAYLRGSSQALDLCVPTHSQPVTDLYVFTQPLQTLPCETDADVHLSRHLARKK